MEFLKSPAAAAEFWRICCERGISLFEGPMPSQEKDKMAWFVQKNTTLPDRKPWNSSYTFSSLELAIKAITHYFKTGEEPAVEEEKK